jgi:transcriptional antiterminator
VESVAKTKYHITLSESEKETLTRIICDGTESERTVMRAKILLMSDAGRSEKLSMPKLAEKLGTTSTTIQSVRTEYATEGFESALYRKQRSSMQYKTKISDEVIQFIVALSETEPPKGTKHWSCEMLAEAVVEAGLVESISIATVLRILKTRGTENSNIRRRKNNTKE